MDELMTRLQSINVDKKIEDIKVELKQTKDTKRINTLVKQLKILTNLKDIGLSPYEAFTRKTVPIIPAQFRSPLEMPGGSLYNPDINELAKNVGIANEALREAKESLPYEDVKQARKDLYLITEDLMGFEDPKNSDFKNNYWAYNTPPNKPPKEGFFQDVVIRKRNDLTGRSVISPNPKLDMDQIEIPIDMGLKKYSPFIIQELMSRGYSKQEAQKMIDKKDQKALDALHRQGKFRPILINRAPSIWKGSVTAHYPIFVNKQNINIPNVVAQALVGDFDGDCVISSVKIVSYKNHFLRLLNLTRFALGIICSLIKIKNRR